MGDYECLRGWPVRDERGDGGGNHVHAVPRLAEDDGFDHLDGHNITQSLRRDERDLGTDVDFWLRCFYFEPSIPKDSINQLAGECYQDGFPVQLPDGLVSSVLRYVPVARHRYAYQQYLAARSEALGSENRGTPLVSRTLLPPGWFSGDANWELLLARKWRYLEHITRGEARVSMMGVDLFARLCLRCPLLLGTDFLAITDNLAAACTWSRGRATPFDLNAVARRRAALEGVFGIRNALPWVDTHRQPADGGTRPGTDGRLSLSRPEWRLRGGCCVIGRWASLFGSWLSGGGFRISLRVGDGVEDRPLESLATSKGRNEVLSHISGGGLDVAVFGLTTVTFGHTRDGSWRLAAECKPWRDPDRVQMAVSTGDESSVALVHRYNLIVDAIAEGMCTAYAHAVPIMVVGPKFSQVWLYPSLLRALHYCHCTSVAFLDQLPSDRKKVYRLATCDRGHGLISLQRGSILDVLAPSRESPGVGAIGAVAAALAHARASELGVAGSSEPAAASAAGGL